MAASRKLLTSKHLTETVAACLRRHVSVQQRLCVALSGGVDSLVLLHVLHDLSTVGQFSFSLSACHVHHGLSSHADEWSAHCQFWCDQRGIALTTHHVAVPRQSGEGIEQAARRLRHAALEGETCDWIVLAQHQDDQAETVLLNLFRGAAVRGMAAMSEVHGRRLRPLLGVSRREILAYAEQHGLLWVEDESNTDQRYRRNWLRGQVFPLLQQTLPDVSARLAGSAAAFGEASQVLDDMARLDGAATVPLPLASLHSLPQHRALNVLSFHLSQQGIQIPSRVWLLELLRQLSDCAEDAQPALNAGSKQLYRYRDALWLVDKAIARQPAALVWPVADGSTFDMAWGDGRIVASPVVGQGVSLACLLASGQPVNFVLRQGGERIRLRQNAPRRALKDLLREHDVPPWRRSLLPLLFCGDALVWVPGIGIAAEFACNQEEVGIQLEFLPPTW